MKPCQHQEAQAGCRICWLFETDRRYRELWSRPAKRRVPTRCVHLGPIVEVIGGGCGRCHIRDCALAGLTTIQDCMVCPEYRER